METYHHISFSNRNNTKEPILRYRNLFAYNLSSSFCPHRCTTGSPKIPIIRKATSHDFNKTGTTIPKLFHSSTLKKEKYYIFLLTLCLECEPPAFLVYYDIGV